MNRRLGALALVALAVALPVLAQDKGAPGVDKDADPKRWLGIKKWEATLDVHVSGSREKIDEDASLARSWWRTSYGAKATLEVESENDAFIVLRGKLVTDGLSAQEELYTQTAPNVDDGTRSTMTRALRTTGQVSIPDSGEPEICVTIDLAKQTYQLTYAGPCVNAETTVNMTGPEQEPSESTTPCFYTVPAPFVHEKIKHLEDEFFPRFKLPARGLRVIGVGQFNYRPMGAADGRLELQEKPARATVLLKMAPDGREPLDLVISPRLYSTWQPIPSEKETEPGNALDVDVRLQKPDGKNTDTVMRRIRYVLAAVSHEKGVCCNYPKNGKSDPDLRFDAKTLPTGLKLAPDGLSGETDWGEYKEQMVRINAYDGAAYGQLRVVADLSDGSTIVGHLVGDKGALDVTIPLDEDDNHIADSWEKATAKGKPPSWDEDPTPAGTKSAGDGIPLFEEYRGFFVLEGGKRTFKRLDPKAKESFYLDVNKARVFNAAMWNKATRGALAYEIDGETVQGGNPGKDLDFPRDRRIVDFNAGYAKGKGKTARFIHCDDNAGRIYATAETPGAQGNDDRSVMGSNREGPDKETYLMMFPTHIALKVKDGFVNGSLAAAAAGWTSDPAGVSFEAAGFTHAQVQKAHAAVRANPALAGRFASRFVELTILHEFAHAHRVNGHRPNPDENETAGSGFGTCPMYYWGGVDNRQGTMLEILGPLDPDAVCFRMSRFCKSGDAAPAGSTPEQTRNYGCLGELDFK